MPCIVLMLFTASIFMEPTGARELGGKVPPPAPSAWNKKLAELRAARARAQGFVSVNSSRPAAMLDFRRTSPSFPQTSPSKQKKTEKSIPVVKSAAIGATSAVVVNATRHSAMLDANIALAARYEKAVPGFDATEEKQYRTCAIVIKAAWHEEANSPCSANAHNARDSMKNEVPACVKLNMGAEYLASYKDLLEQTDIWCDGPVCKPGCTGSDRCVRYKDFPFQAMCEDSDKFWGIGRIDDHEHPDLVKKPQKNTAHRGTLFAMFAVMAIPLL